MPSVNDIVELSSGSVGVISEVLAHGYFRVQFFDSRKDVLPADIAQTLSAPTYNVNDQITVWPYSGTITAINGDDFTVDVDRQQVIPNLGPITWTGSQTVPRWRVIKDNDSRIERQW